MRGSFVLLIYFIVSLISWSHPRRSLAGTFVATCDERGAEREQCQDWGEKSLRELGCTVTHASPTNCFFHHWGSDFIESWMCHVSSPDCEAVSPNQACPSGTVRVFNEGWSACQRVSDKPKKFLGVCHQQNVTQRLTLSECKDVFSHCEVLGGEPTQLSVLCQNGKLKKPIEVTAPTVSCQDVTEACQKTRGTPMHSWFVACSFKDNDIERTGSSCEAIQKRCEEANSPLGVKGFLKSCVLSK